jgi:type II secretory pathway pseudopilin PulG
MKGRARELSAQDGVSLVEVMVGALITALIAGAVAVALVNSNDSALATQRQAQLVAALQNRMEWIHQLFSETYTSTGFAAVALSQNPHKGKDSSLPRAPEDPNDFIVGYDPNYQTAAAKKPYEGFLIEKNYNGTEQGLVTNASAEGEQLQVDSASGKITSESLVDPATGKTFKSEEEALASGRPYAIVNTYVTLATEDVSQVPGGCLTSAGAGSTAGDARRIIIAARLHPPESQARSYSAPQYATTLLTNPTPSSQCQHAYGLVVPTLPVPQ